MKTKVLHAAALLLISSFAHAQIDKGRLQVGGSISVDHQKYETHDIDFPGYTVTNVFASPSIGRFYKTNRLAGLFLNFAYAENTNASPSITRSYGGGIFFRQYQTVLKKLYIYLDEQADYNYISRSGNSFPDHGYSIGASLQTGMAYDVTRKMQLELSLNGLAYADYSHNGNTKEYVIGTSLDKTTFSNIGFGFRYYLK